MNNQLLAWLIAGVLFSVIWHVYKAIQYVTNDFDRRIKRLEQKQEKKEDG